jgi:hypothetical protein
MSFPYVVSLSNHKQRAVTSSELFAVVASLRALPARGEVLCLRSSTDEALELKLSVVPEQ